MAMDENLQKKMEDEFKIGSKSGSGPQFIGTIFSVLNWLFQIYEVSNAMDANA